MPLVVALVLASVQDLPMLAQLNLRACLRAVASIAGLLMPHVQRLLEGMFNLAVEWARRQVFSQSMRLPLRRPCWGKTS